MDRLRVFDRALFGKQIGGIGMIVGLDVIYLIFSPFYGRMNFNTVGGILLFTNMLNTCILYQNFILSRGEAGFELNTKKIVYYPTTRREFLWNKYAKTLIFLLIQQILTAVCLSIGKLASRGEMDNRRYLIGGMIVLLGILGASGTAILLMHLMPFGLYLTMFLFYPPNLLIRRLEWLQSQLIFKNTNEITFALSIVAIAFILWLFLFWIGVKIYEKVN